MTPVFTGRVGYTGIHTAREHGWSVPSFTLRLRFSKLADTARVTNVRIIIIIIIKRYVKIRTTMQLFCEFVSRHGVCCE